jgi:hypothetical protein
MRIRAQSGQAIVLVIGLIAGAALLAVALGALGQGLLGKGRHQRAADLSALCAARAMGQAYPRLFASGGLPIDREGYTRLATEAALICARRNGLAEAPLVRFGGADRFAPLRVTVIATGRQDVAIAGGTQVPVEAEATAEISPEPGATTGAAEPGPGAYGGPLAYRQGKPMRPDVARAFDRMAGAARREAGIALTISSAFRTDAEQAALFAANPDPKWVAPPGTSLHRLGTELDLGPPSAHGWLGANSERFGFIRRYSWEPWHYGYVRDPGTTSVGFGRRGSPDGSKSAVPDFVPEQYQPTIAAAAQRWNVSAGLLAAQLYAESNFNPLAESSAGARGIAQFMPGTAAAYGLADRTDAHASIGAQAHLMHDLLRRFASVPLALAAYNAGEGAVAACGCIPPYPETKAYVARILGLLNDVGEGAAPSFTVRLVK